MEIRRITDFWDQREEAIAKRSSELAELDQRELTLAEIRNEVATVAASLSDRDLSLAGFTMIDDLYKALADTTRISDITLDYLKASAGVLTSALRDRGITIHYVVNNNFRDLWGENSGPLWAYGDWFRSAGFAYVCPQEAAVGMMQHDGIQLDSFQEHWPRYVEEAWAVVKKVIIKCEANNDHCALIDGDVGVDFEDLLDTAIKQGRPGAITIYRQQAPVEGSKVRVWSELLDETLAECE